MSYSINHHENQLNTDYDRYNPMTSAKAEKAGKKGVSASPKRIRSKTTVDYIRPNCLYVQDQDDIIHSLI